MRYKIVKDKDGKFHVKSKRFWLSPWRYARRPKYKGPGINTYRYVWVWDTEKGAQAYINQELLRQSTKA